MTDEGFALRKQGLAGAACLLLLFAVAAPSAQRDPEKQLQDVRGRIEELQRSIRRDTDRRDSLSAQLRDAEEKVRNARGRLGGVRKQLAGSDARLSRLTAERERTERDLREQRMALATQLRSAYMSGREEQIKLLLSQQDPAAFGRMLVYYSYLGRARAGKIAEIETAAKTLEQAVQQEAEEKERLAALEADSRKELSSVDSARTERGKAVRAINSQIRNNSDTIAKLKREAAALEKLVADLRQALRDLPPGAGQAFEKVRGRLAWPAGGRIVARFGQPRGGGLKWNGVMIEAGRGTEIRALYEGRIVYSDWLPGMGLLLIIDHGGYMSLYAHNEQLFKAVGDRVEGGEVVATVGDSGGRSQPGLYLEIRRGATPVDPIPWFRRPAP
ncbi:MAG: peptidoglycan DD-metalloendopeptidase family protein [Gammaproteobacteria bacterium]|nr:peptidoglycan DD-metalloendopeptidase family protein [Gammaproteobacteria bacterium]